MLVDTTFPAPFQVLFAPKRYKVFFGGRGGGKSWAIARALLILGTQRKHTVLCAREFQKSISESVHKLLENQIRDLGLDYFYRIEQKKIYGNNGTEFSFEGIRNNVSAIRSYEGVTICWVEEAATVSANSWAVLIPTIRDRGSEIWLSFNPELEDDPTYARFIKDPDLSRVDGEAPEELERLGFAEPIKSPIFESKLSFVVKTSWRDNPWFEEGELPAELAKLKREDPDEYLHVWEGHPRRSLAGAIYANELRKAELEDRITSVPYESDVPVDTFWDLGRSNNTAIWFIQRVALQWRVLDFYEARLEELSHYLQVCQSRGYFFGTMFLPHDAKHKRLGYANSIEEQFRKSGYRVHIIPAMSPMDRINATKVAFGNCWFDRAKCEDGLTRLRHYRYKVDEHGKFSNAPLHDDASDAADAFGHFGVTTSTSRERTRSGVLSKLAEPVMGMFGFGSGGDQPSSQSWLR